MQHLGDGDHPPEALGEQLRPLRGQTGDLEVDHQLAGVALQRRAVATARQHAEQADGFENTEQGGRLGDREDREAVNPFVR